MLRVAIAIVFAFGAVVALAFVFSDLCDGFDRNRSLEVVVAGACLGGLVGTVLAGSFRERPSAPWAIGILTTIVASFGLYVLFALVWVGKCSS